MVEAEQQWVASIPFSSGRSIAGRFALFGGTLLLDDEELTFTPLAGIGPVRRWRIRDVRSVEAFADRPPRLQLMMEDGRALVLMVLSRRSSAVWSRDCTARDQAVRTIKHRLTQR